MSDLARICDTLNATAVIGNAACGVIPAQALANAINRTTLPRRLDIQRPDVGQIRLFVRNRRLHRMEHDEPHTAPWGMALSPADCDAVAAALCAACPDGTWIGIGVHRPNPDDAFDGIGIAAGLLLDRLTGQTAQAPERDLQARILEIAGRERAQIEAAFVMGDGAIAALLGDDEVVEALLPEVTDIMAQVADESFALAGSLETDGMLVLPRNDAAMGCHLLVGHLGMIGLLVLPDATPGAARSLWSAEAA